VAKEKKPRFTVVTPVGVAAYSYLDKPDTEGKFADGKFKTTLVLDGDADLAAIDAKALAAAQAEWGPKVKVTAFKPPYIQIDEDAEDKPENQRGKFIIRAKSKFQPALKDSAKNDLPDGVKIYSGDRIRAIIEMIPNTAGGSKQVSPRLLAVQLIEKRAQQGGGNWGDEFDEVEDGFVASEKSAGGDGAAADDNTDF
jgi:ssDNA-binding protein